MQDNDKNKLLIDSTIKDEFTKNKNFSKDLLEENESINNLLNLNNQSNLNSLRNIEKELDDLDLNNTQSNLKIKLENQGNILSNEITLENEIDLNTPKIKKAQVLIFYYTG